MINISDPGLLPVLALFGLAVFVAFPLIVLSSNEAKPIAFLQSKLGLDAVWAPVLLIGAALWAIVFGLLVVGLLSVIWEIIQGVHWKSTASGMSNSGRFALVRLTAITATTGAVIAFPLTLIKVKLTRDANDTTVQSQITDRINKAVEGLGAEKTVKRQRHDQDGNPTYEKDTKGSRDYSKPVFVETSEPNLEVRIGSIFALERIARESPDFHVQVMEILCAYVRLNSPVTTAGSIPRDLEPSERGKLRKKVTKPRIDIQMVIKVIGNRRAKNLGLEVSAGFTLDLSETNLQQAELVGNWRNTNFSDSALDFVVMNDADLSNSNLGRVKLSRASWRGTNLDGSNLLGAQVMHTDLGSQHTPVAPLFDAKGMPPMFHGCIFRNQSYWGSTFSITASDTMFRRCTFDRQGQVDDLINENTSNRFPECALRTVTLEQSSIAELRWYASFSIHDFFGDASVTCIGFDAPPHWPEFILEDEQFASEYQKWLNAPDNYTPPTAR
ncbi:pentapeptide repeat-containing protein [Phaeobacter piscinae]|uniref:pentapeptide repeat-containing protein n=1 Tax=Phaeobacter piscinae TaxID=1580596 RepID=UPI000BBE4B17|nr:pentapeptide repeat-containing protein [Phaeobacter piscinae]ATG39842.1 putative low-complexity protein [Phaeobacter piscinae]